MQILSVHNSYIIRGGEDESCELEEQLLRQYGHHVYAYRESNHDITEMSPVSLAARTIWSGKSYHHIKELLKANKYDLVHVQNFFPLISPSIYYAAASCGVPVVQTLRNYRLVCPNALLFRNQQPCEDCIGKPIPWPAIAYACYRNNRSASMITSTMLSFHRLIKTWVNKVDLYITLSEFAKQKLIAGGIPGDKIVVKPNFVDPDPGIGRGQGEYALYVGRLSSEKGIDTLLEAWINFKIPIPLKLVGDGPLMNKVTEFSLSYPNLILLGRKSNQEVLELIGEAKFLLFPSRWYETFGRVAIEAFAKGTPVIAANIGAIAELVHHNFTGLLFEAGNMSDLASKVFWFLDKPHELARMRIEARKEFESKYTASSNYKKLFEIYSLVCSKNISAVH